MYEDEYARIWIENDILFLEYQHGLELTQKVARVVVNSRITYQQNREYAIFCDTSGIIEADFEALTYLALEGLLLIKAIAFYPKFPPNILLTKFFLETLQENIPADIFETKNQAINFLIPYSK
ncbi:STAS/SEC14 domain-containing protein [Salegentibacter sp. LM13S]|uniref:DUF7793 family protein n=1 Tax=Salegentibacter lacus TaxID=2873599 RepID=UPI001CCDCC18|nr:STAS/SEC14 domain-containing protein [Salegentibacter lacus]MBZ9629792.1 STAS/SEC14 domain-containing protein [Salegentibacter lacus]